MTILISAIVSTYNAAEQLSECLNDLECQSISDQLEIIVVDSGSLQNEGIIVNKFKERYKNIRYIRTQSRETVYQAWNRGIRIARGRYITNANTDDRHRVDAFERMAKYLEQNSEIALVYADLIKTKIKNETFDKCTPSGRFRWPDWDRNLLLVKGCFIGPQPMWRRSVHELYGYFEKEFVTSGDYEFWLRISQTLEFYHLRDTLGLYLESPDSIEHRNRKQQTIENHRILSRYNKSAQTKKIILYKPFEEFKKVFSNELLLTKEQVMAAFNLIEKPHGIKNNGNYKPFLSTLPDCRKYFKLKKKVLKGQRSRETVKQILNACSNIILNRAKWFQSYFKSRENTLYKLTSLSTKKLNKSQIDCKDLPGSKKMVETKPPIVLENRMEDGSLAFRHFNGAGKNEKKNLDLKKCQAACCWNGLCRAEDALKIYIDILKTHPDDIETLIAIGKICQSLNREDDAWIFYERVLEIEPANSDARSQLLQRRGSPLPAF